MIPIIAGVTLFIKTRKLSTALFLAGILISAVLAFIFQINLHGINELISTETAFWLNYLALLISNIGLFIYALSLPKKS